MNTKKGPMKTILTTTVAALVLLSACGSDADTAADGEVETAPVTEADTTPVTEAEPATTSTAEPEPEPDVDTEVDPALEADVTAYAEAFGTGEADDAWNTVSVRCQGVVPETEYRDAVDFLSLEAPEQTASNISAVVDGDRAAVTYDTYDGSGAFVFTYTAQPWLFSDGKWHWDAC